MKAECDKEDQQGFKSVFNARLDNLEKKIEQLINKDDIVREPKRVTYADITREDLTKQEITIKSFIKEEKEEERWINSTKCNMIVHHLGENKHEDKEEQRIGDKDYVEEVVKNRMGFDVDIVSTERIGTRKEDMFISKRWRPLKVTLKNEEEKKQIMASVHKLAKWDFRITDDFSKKERETIKERHRKAKDKTKEENDETCVWKVRGSPRTRLYLKKTRNKTVTDDEQL